MRRTTLMFGALFVMAGLLAGSASAATVYSAAAGWSIANNPNGFWSYGNLDQENSDTDTNMTNFDASYANWDSVPEHLGVEAWALDGTQFGAVAVNTTADPQMVHGSIQIESGQMVLHPSNSASQAANVRFTATAEMYVNIAATFASANLNAPTASDVHVYVNGISVFDSNVSGVYGGPAVSYSSALPILLQVGDTIDFPVGYGDDNFYGNDATSLMATVTVVPEPSSVFMLVLGSMSMGFVKRRRRN